jgi:hypothetical protein
MTDRLMRRVGTFNDGRQSAIFSCRPIWYARVEDTFDSEDYR